MLLFLFHSTFCERWLYINKSIFDNRCIASIYSKKPIFFTHLAHGKAYDDSQQTGLSIQSIQNCTKNGKHSSIIVVSIGAPTELSGHSSIALISSFSPVSYTLIVSLDILLATPSFSSDIYSGYTSPRKALRFSRSFHCIESPWANATASSRCTSLTIRYG